MKHQWHHVRAQFLHKVLLFPFSSSFLGLLFDWDCFMYGSPASTLPSSGEKGLGKNAHTGQRSWCQICQRDWLHPSVASWPNNQPQVSSPVGTVGSRQTGVWLGASPAFSSQLMPSPSVLRTCQWETVLTHQIMAERKLLQGGDILRWQYGDVNCAPGGEWEWGGGIRSLKRHKLLQHWYAQVHREKGWHKYSHSRPFPPRVRTHERQSALFWRMWLSEQDQISPSHLLQKQEDFSGTVGQTCHTWEIQQKGSRRTLPIFFSPLSL